MFHDNRVKPWKVSLEFNPKNHTILNLRQDIAALCKKDYKNLFFTYLSYQTARDFVPDKEMTNDVKKKSKHLNMFCLEFPTEWVEIPAAEKF